MTEKKKAACDVRGITSGGDGVSANGSGITISDFTIRAGAGQGPIERLLLQGQENRISTRNLMKLAGYKSIRNFRRQIARERKAGALILSVRDGGGGYFVPSEGMKGQREIREYLATFSAQAADMFRVASATRKALEIPGQTEIEV